MRNENKPETRLDAPGTPRMGFSSEPIIVRRVRLGTYSPQGVAVHFMFSRSARTALNYIIYFHHSPFKTI